MGVAPHPLWRPRRGRWRVGGGVWPSPNRHRGCRPTATATAPRRYCTVCTVPALVPTLPALVPTRPALVKKTAGVDARRFDEKDIRCGAQTSLSPNGRQGRPPQSELENLWGAAVKPRREQDSAGPLPRPPVGGEGGKGDRSAPRARRPTATAPWPLCSRRRPTTDVHPAHPVVRCSDAVPSRHYDRPATSPSPVQPPPPAAPPPPSAPSRRHRHLHFRRRHHRRTTPSPPSAPLWEVG